jgi:transposase-like protein
MFLIRGIVFNDEAVRDWEAKLTPFLIDSLQRRCIGRIGKSWQVGETYIKVNGGWCYLHRAIDRSGVPVDARLSETWDLAAAVSFFRSAGEVTGTVPAHITADGHDSSPRATRTRLDEDVKHRTSQYLTRTIAGRKAGTAQYEALNARPRRRDCAWDLMNSVHPSIFVPGAHVS